VVLSLPTLACGRAVDGGTPTGEGRIAAPSPSAATSSTPAPPEVARPAPPLHRVWPLAIAADPDEEHTFVVDSFVAALVFEHIASGAADEWVPVRPTDRLEGGYRLTSIPDGIPYDAVGLQPGDVVESLNGVVLTGPERFGFALDGAATLAVASIHRDERQFSLKVRLEGGRAWMARLAEYSGEPRDTSDTGGVESGELPLAADPSTEPAPVAEAGGSSSRPPAKARPSTSPATRPTATPGAKRPSSTAAKVQCATSTRCSIDADHFGRLVADPARLEAQADVVPAIRDDVFSGYRLRSVRAGSDVARLGFRAGDKITHINGHDLTQDAEAVRFYLSLPSSKLFKIRYERGGQRLVKTVTVQ
jgi:type II secretory pathway component PulC